MFIAVRRGRSGAWALIQERPTEADPDASSEIVPMGQMTELIPGLSVAVESFELPDSKVIDLVGVDANGGITLGLCRLARTAEIRQMCVSRLLEMAARLRREVPFREFEQRVLLLKGRPVEDLVRDALPEEDRPAFDCRDFRLRLAQNLEQGRFRLVLAVDEIEEDLEGFLDYLRDSSDGLIRFEPVELAIFDCEDMQVMVPRVRRIEDAPDEDERFDRELRDASSLPDRTASLSTSDMLRILDAVPEARDAHQRQGDPFETLDEVLEAEAAAAAAELEALDAEGYDDEAGFELTVVGRHHDEDMFFTALGEAASLTAVRAAHAILTLGREPGRQIPGGWVVSEDTLSFQACFVGAGPDGPDPRVIEVFRLESDGALVFDVPALIDRISEDLLDEFIRDLESNPLLSCVLCGEDETCALPLDQAFVTEHDVRTFCSAIRRLVTGIGLVGDHDTDTGHNAA